MSNITTTVRATTSINGPTIYNVSVLVANTEVSLPLSARTKKFLFRVRGMANAKLAYISGDSGTTYVTIPRGSTMSEDNLNAKDLILYFQLDQPGHVVEVVEWS